MSPAWLAARPEVEDAAGPHPAIARCLGDRHRALVPLARLSMAAFELGERAGVRRRERRRPPEVVMGAERHLLLVPSALRASVRLAFAIGVTTVRCTATGSA